MYRSPVIAGRPFHTALVILTRPRSDSWESKLVSKFSKVTRSSRSKPLKLIHLQVTTTRRLLTRDTRGDVTAPHSPKMYAPALHMTMHPHTSIRRCPSKTALSQEAAPTERAVTTHSTSTPSPHAPSVMSERKTEQKTVEKWIAPVTHNQYSQESIHGCKLINEMCFGFLSVRR